MQHINDDIDDLFRNAADNYPLKINGADWESVADRLNNGENEENFSPVPFLSSSKTNKNYRYLLLLLLLPIGLLTAKYAGLTGGGNDVAPTANNVATGADKKQADTPADNKMVAAGDKKAGDPVSSTSAKNNNTAASNISAPEVKLVSQTPVGASRGGVKQINIQQGTAAKVEPGNTGERVSRIPPLSELHNIQKQVESETIVLGKDKTIPVNNTPGDNNPAATVVVTNDNLKQPGTDELGAKKDVAPPLAQAAKVAEPAPGKKDDNTGGPFKKKPVKHFYLGAFVAPDYTTVKYQPGNKVGFDYGGLLGYSFTNSISLELGIATDKKYYTTDGRYYNSKQPWLANAGKLLTLSGYSSLTEFPLNVKYNFKPGRKNRDGNFFASAGLVSYIVHEENYDYEFDKSGYIYHRDKSTKISSTDMFANISVSAGYESSLGNFWNFRVEPYYRVPVKGIGLGSLPITSIGLNIGITKKIK